jgi:site-specific DNA-methyltransferase (adenine-specific)
MDNEVKDVRLDNPELMVPEGTDPAILDLPKDDIVAAKSSKARYSPTRRRSRDNAKDDWATPQDLFEALDAEFHFDIDAAADAANAKCKRYYTREQDGLSQLWDGTVFCNPPYGNGITDKWVKKASEAVKQGATVVMLIPIRPGTVYWHAYINYKLNVEVRILKGRLKFVGAKDSAPFESAIVIFHPPGWWLQETLAKLVTEAGAISMVKRTPASLRDAAEGLASLARL